MEENKDIKIIKNNMFIQSNYYARELEYVIDNIKEYTRSIDINSIKKNNKFNNIIKLIDYINSIKYKDVFNNSKDNLQYDLLMLKIKEKNNQKLHDKESVCQ